MAGIDPNETFAMRHSCPLGILIFAPLCAPIQATATDVVCMNRAVVDYQTFPEGAVEWDVSATPDPEDVSDELTVDVLAIYKIEGKMFVHARFYVGENTGQNFDLMTSEAFPNDPRDDNSLVIALSFGTSELTENTVTFKFAYHSKIPCPDQITVYELPLSEILGRGNVESGDERG